MKITGTEEQQFGSSDRKSGLQSWAPMEKLEKVSL